MTTATPTADSIENAIVDLIGISSLTSNVIETSLSGDADFRKKTYGSSELYYITDDTANGILHGVLKIDADLRGLLDQFSDFRAAEKKGERPAPTEQADNALHGPVRSAWRQAMAAPIPNLSFREMSVAYGILHSVSEALRDICDSPALFDRPGGDFIENIQEDIASIRSAIGEYCMAVSEKSPSDDPADQQNLCDAVALTEASFDPEGYADLIASIGARWVKKNRKAAARRKASAVTAEAA